MVPTLERIAPVLHFDTFSAAHDNAEAARDTFLELARLFDREALAVEKLAERDARIAALAEAIKTRFEGDPPDDVAVASWTGRAPMSPACWICSPRLGEPAATAAPACRGNKNR